MKFVWERLIRFIGDDEKTYYGEPILANASNFDKQVATGTLCARLIEGDIFDDSAVMTGRVVKVGKLLSPLASKDVPIIRCVGLNYMEHIKEVGQPIPPFPVTFIKPSTSVARWNEDIPIPKIAQDDQADYEGELCFVIGKQAKDVPKDKALEFVGGFIVGNDVSARKWQSDPKLAGLVPQFNFSKGFDKFAPLGPMLVSTAVVGAANNLHMQTRVNGELRQDSTTSDLIFDVPAIIAFLSQGTTLEKGCVVMTGTPPGAAFSMKPPKWLKHGDVVEVSIEELGTTRNRIVVH